MYVELRKVKIVTNQPDSFLEIDDFKKGSPNDINTSGYCQNNQNSVSVFVDRIVMDQYFFPFLGKATFENVSKRI